MHGWTRRLDKPWMRHHEQRFVPEISLISMKMSPVCPWDSQNELSQLLCLLHSMRASLFCCLFICFVLFGLVCLFVWCVCLLSFACMCMCVWKSVCMYACISIYIHECMYACVFVSFFVCLFLFCFCLLLCCCVCMSFFLCLLACLLVCLRACVVVWRANFRQSPGAGATMPRRHPQLEKQCTSKEWLYVPRCVLSSW